ncbi:hypothetical protein [Streptomyces lateritius]|uniref:hypothetical protein n=1 Tax=Streptomyces lateritius TaxID=67313 RepID=UPI0016743055|nr:hypothetical protein [Streptomyces lateritius]GGT88896.1 lipoprotein [Streptomyces lateritius]
MRATALRRTAVATTTVSLALLVTACGGGKEDSGDKGKDAPKASASASAAPDAKALSAAELEKLIVEQADVPGYQVQKAKPTDVVPSSAVTTDKPACKPLADALSFIATGNPGASVQRKAIAEPKKDTASSPEDIVGALGAPVTAVTLGSYDGNGAQDAFASLKTAGTECAGGFTLNGGGEKTKISKVAPEAVTAGEEAVAFTVTTDMDGEPFISKVVAFRKGNTLASFSVISLAGKVKEFPKAVVDAQVAKLA